MAESKMKEVAKLLGVEMGVPFNIKHKNGEKLNYCPYTFKNNHLYDRDNDRADWSLICLLDGTYEIEKTILDDVEKRYLEGVLKPFKDRVEYIKKCDKYIKDIGNKEHLAIVISSNISYSCYECIPMPFFDKGTMYRGMEVDKKYTLEELGLFQDEKGSER